MSQDKEREAFEAWWKSRHGHLPVVGGVWEVWQARAALKQQPAAQTIPAAWVEAVKVAREALVEVKHGLEGAKIWAGMQWHYNPLHPFKYLPLKETATAALAQLDALTKEQT